MKSKTKIEKQLKGKNNKYLVETIVAAKKNKNWFNVAEQLSQPSRNRKNINLGELNKVEEKAEILVIPGKVLSSGDLEKKIKLVALAFSEGAKEKLKEAKIEFKTILEEIKNNKDAKGVKILK